MKINEVESLVGITKKNIRFYEEKGLLSPSRNSGNGYREYGLADVETLRRIKLLRKLGIPIEEIRRMQGGEQTLGDGLRRHLVTLEREKHNLEQATRLCTLLQERTESLNELDTDAILQEMERLEQSGTTFQNKQRQDIRIFYVAPVLIALATIGLMAAIIWLFVWAICIHPENAPPLAVVCILLLFPILVMIGVLLALWQRIKEIRKGEMNDARNY